jgi:inorganic pyrophosphatase
VLQAGAAFPYDFGFIPGTKADDGDPVDVLVLMDEPAFTGCLIRCRLIGVIVAEQTKDGKSVRNDRLIAVANSAETYRDLRSLRDVNDKLLDELVHFFVSYNETKSREFEVLEIRGKNPARKLVEKSITANGKNGRS